MRPGGSITAALSACGVDDFACGHSRVGTRLPGDAEARWLKMPKTSPVLVSESVVVA